MKLQQAIIVLITLPVASTVLAQQTLTFPPAQQQAANQTQYPGTARPGPSFPSQRQQQIPTQGYAYSQPSYYPYYYNNNYYGYSNPYANSYYPYGYAYSPYAMQQQRMRPYPPSPQKKEIKPWGDTRYIWPDFYTDFTGDFWDEMINAPYDMGYMPGGWRFPSFSSPDPVTVTDAIANQVPPFAEEAGNMVPLDDAPNVLPF